MATTESPAIATLEREQPTLEFKFMKRLAYGYRMIAVTTLVFTGLFLQVILLSAAIGLPFFLPAILLCWVVGFDNKLDRRAMKLDATWETVPFDRIAAIADLDRKTKRWDASAIDISSGGGCVLLVVLLAAAGAGGVVAAVAGYPAIAPIVLVDVALLLGSQWLSGMRTVHRQPDLMVKVNHLQAVWRRVGQQAAEQGEVRAQLLVKGTDEQRFPTDVRVSIRYPEAPPSFYGVQVQVVLNRVQGTPYPYGYAVLVAQQGTGLLANTPDEVADRNVVVEKKTENDVDVVVIRQRTSRTSGYHTKPHVTAKILVTATELARHHAARIS